MDDEQQELILEFISESMDILESSEPMLINLDGATAETVEDTVNTIFRMFHTMKGGAGFLGFKSCGVLICVSFRRFSSHF